MSMNKDQIKGRVKQAKGRSRKRRQDRGNEKWR
jgi:uncharacterized protein YjbJ (UPF0337 family)